MATIKNNEIHLWASELGSCPAKAYLKAIGVEGSAKLPSSTWWLTVGKETENEVLKQLVSLQNSPIVRYDSQQKEVKLNLYKNIYVVGKLDAIGYDGNNTPYVVEVKTMGRRVFEKFLKRGIKAVKYYMPQIQFYMHMSGIKRAILVARDRDSFMEFYTQNAPHPYPSNQYRIHFDIAEYDKEYINKILTEYAMAFQIAELDNWQSIRKPSGVCFYCEYQNICQPPITKVLQNIQQRNETLIEGDIMLDDYFETYQKLTKWFEQYLSHFKVGAKIETENAVYEVRERNGYKYLAKLE